MQQANLPERMRRARKEAGLTLQKAAELSNRHWMTIWRGEKGATEPEKATLADLAEVYGKPLEWFYRVEDEVEATKFNETQADYKARTEKIVLIEEIVKLLGQAAAGLSVQELKEILKVVRVMTEKGRG